MKMRDLSCEIFASVCIIVVLLSQFVTEARENKSCSTSAIFGEAACGPTERCLTIADETGRCICLLNYQRQGDECVPIPTTTESWVNSSTMKQDVEYTSSGGSVVAGLLIPLFLITLGVVIFFSARRYKWVQRLRQYQQNRYGNVLVTRDDDDDDPPIV